ncbi:MAG: ribose 5-phosphate isomerase A [Anaerolineales bacterium]
MNLKLTAALRALDFVQSGMVLGLGSGTTTAYFVDLLGEQLKSDRLRNIQAVPTSENTATHARSIGIPLISLTQALKLARTPGLLDLVVDGADEVDPQLNLIKGLGKALLREKIVEIHTQNLIIIVDDSKIVPRLGSSVSLPVEILPFEYEVTISWLNTLGCRAELWLEEGGAPVVTDNGNNLALCHFEAGIMDAYWLADKLAERPGVIEHGLFLDMACRVIVASSQDVRVLEALQSTSQEE